MSAETTTNIEVLDSVEELKYYNLVFLNDNTTTFEFVIFLLETIIEKTKEEALELTYKIHENGSAIVKTDIETILIAIQKEIKLLALEEGFEFKTAIEKQE